jgi:hypothetical protein
MSTINTVNAYYQAILRITPSSALAQALATQIDSGALTLSAFEGQLLSQSFNSTIPALVVYDAFFGTTPNSGGLTFLTGYANQLTAQGFSLQNVYVNLGASFAQTGNTFTSQYGAMNNATFLTTAYTSVFGVAPTPDAQNYLLNQFSFYQNYFGGSSIAAKGAIYGILLYISDGEQNGKYAAPAAEFLNAAATGTAPYGQELISTYGSGLTPIYHVTDNLPNHTTSEGSDVTFSLNTENIATPLAFQTVAPGTVLTYTLSGVAVTQGLINGPVSGQLTVDNNGQATVTIHTLANVLLNAPGGASGLTLTLGSGLATDNVTLTLGSQTVTDNTAGKGVNEGSNVNFTVNTAGVNTSAVAGTVENWTISGPGAAQVQGAHSGQVTLDANGQAVVTLHTLATVFNSSAAPTITLTLANGATDTVAVNEVATQTVTDSAVNHTINQGGAVTFTVTTGGVSGAAVAGTVENWTITGTAASQIVGPTSGQVTLDANGAANVTVNTLANVILGTPSTGSLVFNLVNAASDTVTVNEGTAVVTDNAGGAPIIEGGSVTFTLATTNVAPGTVEQYTLTGAGTAQVTGPLTGTLTVGANGQATVTVHTLANVFNNPTTPPLTLSINGIPAATDTVTINNNSTISVATPTPVNEGGQLVFTVNTNNVPAGTLETYTLSGLGTSQVTGPLTGVVTIGTNGTGTVTVNTTASVINAIGGPSSVEGVTLTLNGLPGTPPSATGNIVENSTIGVTTGTTPVNEGSPVTFTLAAANVAVGTQVNYTLSGAALGNIPVAQQTGMATVNPNGTVSITVPTLANDFNDPITSKALTLTLNGLNNVPATSPTVATATINENSNFAVVDNANPGTTPHNFNEGSSVTFTINTTNVPVGTQETYVLTGAGTSQVVGPTTGTVTVDATGHASVTVNTLGNNFNGGTSPLTFSLNGLAGATDTVTMNQNATVAITDNAPPPGHPVGGGVINQAQSVTFTIAASTGASAAGATESYTLTDTNAGQLASPSSGTITFDSTGHATVTANTLANIFGSSASAGTLTLTVVNPNLVPIGSDTVTVNNGTANVSHTAGTINEGSPVTFTLATTNMPVGTVESWTLSGAAASQVVGPTSGTVTVGANGQATVTVNTLAGSVVNAAGGPTSTEALNIAFAGLATATDQANITENSTITVATPTPVNEGSQLVFTVNTTNVPAGTVELFTLSGQGASQVTSPLIGTVTIGANGTGTVTVNTAASVINAAGGPASVEGVTLTLNGLPGTPPSATGNIVESATIGVTTSATPVNEGNPVTFTVAAAANVPIGTQVSYQLSGAALGNVPLAQQTGTATVSPNGTVTVMIPTLANDLSGLTKQLTLTLNNLNNVGGASNTTVATANINENTSGIFTLTTGTDVFTGNPVGNNVFNSTDTTGIIPSVTLGQADMLVGGGGPANVLNIGTNGPFGTLLTNFTTTGIQTFNVNANILAAGGTVIDMSGTTGVTLLNDGNPGGSSGSLGLLNVQAPLVLTLANPSDLGVPVNLGVQYIAAQALIVAAQAGGQVLNLDPTVSPVTLLPNSAVNVNVPVFTINLAGGGTGGLVSLNGALPGLGGAFAAAQNLTSVTMVSTPGSGNFVLGNGHTAVTGMAFTNAAAAAGSNTLNLSGFTGAFFTVGDPGFNSAITAVGGLTITFGSGATSGLVDTNLHAPLAMGATYVSGVSPTVTGGGGVPTITAGGNIVFNIAGGSVDGQLVSATGVGSSITIAGSGAGGFLSGPVNPATLTTNSGAVTVTGLNGGLGSAGTGVGVVGGSFILTNTTTANGGNVTINTDNGGVNEQISTGKFTANVTEGGTTGNITLDFSQNLAGVGTQTGFHAALNGPATQDNFIGGVGTNTLLIDPSINNNTSPSGEGTAGGVTNLVLQSPAGTVWAPAAAPNGGGVVPAGSLGLATLGDPTNVFIGGTGNTATGLAGPVATTGLALTAATFTGAASSETFFVDTASTGALVGQVFGFDFGNVANGTATLNLTVQNPSVLNQALTVRDFGTLGVNNNPVKTLNFQSTTASVLNATTTSLTIDTLNALTTLNLLVGTSALVLLDTATQAQTITTVNGSADNANINLMGLMTAASTAGVGYPAGAFAGNGAANALLGGSVGAPSTITLGTGADHVAVAGGSWNITLPGASSTIVVNPVSGNIDTITALGGSDIITDGAVGGGGGQVSIFTAAGNNLIQFDHSGLLPQLQSADIIHSAGANNTVQVLNNGIFMFDANFSQMLGIENFLVAPFSNQIQLDFNANNNAVSVAGLANASSGVTTIPTLGFDIITAGGNAALSSVYVNVGAGYNSPLTFTVGAGGDFGGDNITTHLSTTAGSNPLTVIAGVNAFNTSFEIFPLTVQVAVPGPGFVPEGIFASTTAANTLNLVADNVPGDFAAIFGNGVQGINGIQTIIGSEPTAIAANPETVMSFNTPGFGANTVTTINLFGVTGNSEVYSALLTGTGGQTIIGGTGASDILLGGSGKNIITAHGTVINDIYGGTSAANTSVLTGNSPTAANNVFLFMAQAESPGGTAGVAPSNDETITGFHTATDMILVNPAVLTNSNGTITFVGTGATYSAALALLQGGGTGAAHATEAVFEADNNTLWIDTNNDGNLNTTDMQIVIQAFDSPGFSNGTANFGGLLGLNTAGQITNYLNNIFNPANNINFSGTLLPGQILYGGPGTNNTLTLGNGASTQNGTLFNFQHLAIAAGATVDPSIAQWNAFGIANITGGSGGTVAFSGAGGTTFTITTGLDNYNFSAVTSSVTLNITDTLGGAPGTITGSNFGDTFIGSVGNLIFPANFETIHGGTGNNTLQFTTSTGSANPLGGYIGSPTVTFGTAAGGTTNLIVTKIQNLVLSGNANGGTANNTIAFNAGEVFQNITGQTGGGTDTITTTNMVAGGTINLANDGGGTVNETSNQAGTITFAAGQADLLNSTVGGTITGTITGGGAGSTLALVNGDNISGAAVTGFPTLMLNPSSSVTMTFAEYSQFGAITAPGAADAITLTTAGALGLAFASIETYNMVGGSSITVNGGAPNVNLNSTAAGNTRVTIGSHTVAGNWNLAGANDVLIANTGSDITGVNGGAATTAETLNLTGEITMTFAQYTPFTTIHAPGGADEIVLTTVGAVGLANAAIETYSLIGGSSITVNSLAPNVNLDSTNVAGTTVTINGLTVAGTWDLLAASDTLVATNGADITGVNAGAATTAENLNLVGGITMTLAQYTPFAANITAPGAADSITLTTAGALGLANAAVETYNMVGGSSITVNGGAPNVNLNSTNVGNTAVTINGATVAGNWNLAGANDVLIATNGADIHGVNGGAATTAETLDLTGAITMTLAQYTPFTTINAPGAADEIVLTTAGAVGTANAAIETYSLIGGSSITVNGAAPNVNLESTNVGNTTVTINGLTVAGIWILAGANDVLVATTGADIHGVNAGAATTAETLNLTGLITMTNAQHAGFGTVNAPGAADTIDITDTFTGTTFNGVENYNLLFAGAASHAYTIAGSNQVVTDDATANTATVTINGGLTNVTLDGTAGAAFTVNALGGGTGLTLDFAASAGVDTITLGGTYTGVSITAGTGADTLTINASASISGPTIDLGAGANLVNLNDQSNISGVTNFVAAGGATLTLVDNGGGTAVVTMSAQEHALFAAHAIVAPGTETINIANQATGGNALTLSGNENAVETYGLQAASNTVNLNTATGGYLLHTIAIGGASNTNLINDNNGAPAVAAATYDVTHFDTYSGFHAGNAAAADQFHLVLDGVAQTNGFQLVTATATPIIVNPNSVIDIQTSVGSLLSPTTALANILTLFNNAVTNAAATGEYTFVASSNSGAAIYETHYTHNAGADGIQLVGVLTGVLAEQLTQHNFV